MTNCAVRPFPGDDDIWLVQIYGETVGEISHDATSRHIWQFHRYQPIWNNLPPKIALEAKTFAKEQCAVFNVTRRLMS